MCIHVCNLLPIDPQSPNPCNSYGMNASITPLPAVFPESPPVPGLHPSAQNAMGILPETFFGAPRLTLAAQTLSPLMTFAAQLSSHHLSHSFNMLRLHESYGYETLHDPQLIPVDPWFDNRTLLSHSVMRLSPCIYSKHKHLCHA